MTATTYTRASDLLDQPSSVGLVGLDLPETLEDLLGSGVDVGEDVVGPHVPGRGEGGCAGDDVTRVGPTEGTRGHDGENVLLGDDTGDGHSVGETLGKSHEVGDDVGVLDGKVLSGPSETSLDLVGDHQDAVLVADFSDVLEVSGRGGDVASLSDDGLDEDGGGVLGSGLLEEEVVELEAGLSDELLLRGLLGDAHGVPVREGGGEDAGLG
jgi:hypothetical protein